MAGKNDFRELKQFATKELKFKQDVHMEAAHKGRLLSAPVYSKVNAGVCAALTMEWLKAKLSEGRIVAAFNPVPGLAAAKNLPHQAAVWHSAQFQVAFLEDPGKQIAKLKRLAAEYGLTLRALKSQPGGDFTGAFWTAAEKMAVGEGAYCSCNVKDQRTSDVAGHGVGIAKLNDGIRFFDANVGAYKFADSYKMSQFYDRWGQLYHAKLGFIIEGARAYPVRNDPAVVPPVIRGVS